MGADPLEKFREVPSRYRPIPFWSWNDRLEPEELRRQLRGMARAGMGGFFMHARGGLETDYLGDEWMACVEACLRESAVQGTIPWLYDEDGWPSGFAGGLVPARNPDFHGRWLKVQRNVADPGSARSSDGFLALYQVRPDGSYLRLGAGEGRPPDSEGELVAVCQASTPYYIDVLNPDAVDAFIEETHEKYLSRFPGAFSRGPGDPTAPDNGSAVHPRVAGFFTDEPRFSGSIDRDPPWSVIMPERFRAAAGYDILDSLVALFLPVSGHEKVRYDYYSVASALFVSSFTARIGNWCRQHGVALTGHLMMEESVFVQAANTAGVMPHYEYMDIPGVDWLRRPIGSPVVPKQVSSAAAQLGKRQVITESFALSGWDASFEELKRIAEWQFVNGVNLLCQHLEGYTLRGFRKRDYPPSLFFQQPWWEEYRLFNDYIGRLGMLLSEGESAVRVLLVHPMRSGWVLYDGTSYTSEFRTLDRDFVAVCEALSGAHVEYHLGDETIMAGHGRLDSSPGRPRLAVGRASYEAVALPSLRCLAASTLALLEAFSDAGGLIVAAGELPCLLDGEPSARLDAFLARIVRPEGGPPAAARALRDRLGGFPWISERGEEIESIHITERVVGDRRVWFLVNLDQGKTFRARISLPGTGCLRLYRPEDGSSVPCPCVSREGGSTVAELDFEPMRSRVLVMDPEGKDTIDASASPKDAESRVHSIVPSGDWEIEEVGLNSLVLDSCSYRIDGGPLMPETPVIHLMGRLLELRRPCDIELRFSFRCGVDPSTLKTLFVALERAEEFSVEVNGAPVPASSDGGWWVDTSFRRLNIHPFVREGANEIVLRRRFFQSPKVYRVLFGDDVYETEKNKLTYDVELESIYLVGDFAAVSASPFQPGERNSLWTAGPFSLAPLPRKVRSGDLSVQGFPFFAGRIVLGRDVEIPSGAERVRFEMGKPRAVLAAVSVNGERVGALTWAPWSIDLSERLHPGRNRLSVELWSGNRNLLGPHHHILGEPYNVGPDSFTGRWSWVEKATEAEPASAEDRKRNYWKDGWSVVSFGFSVGGAR